jgi:two-component system, OmpR family, heavy metal sensor histidine kinase CusS
MTQTANRITADRLHERIVAGNPDDELGTLAATLNHMIERLERSFTEMRRFTADAAHELRTPLAVMRSEAEVALRSARSAEEYCRVLENLLEETNRLATMADQLLFLCRQDAGVQPAAHERVQICDLLADVVSNMQLLAEERNVRLTLDANPPCLLSGDSRQLRRVFYNLLDNAVKYTPAGGTVSVTGRSENGRFSATVTDTGIGIPAEHLPHIFERFYQVDSSRSRTVSRTGLHHYPAVGLASGRVETDFLAEPQNGSGLGLSICRSIVHGLGGEILAESHPGTGTRVTVLVPTQPRRNRNPKQDRGIV